jgi:hypothetical protein
MMLNSVFIILSRYAHLYMVTAKLIFSQHGRYNWLFIFSFCLLNYAAIFICELRIYLFCSKQADSHGSTGCYDLACNGSVPVNNAPITPGDILEPNNGQLKITIKIFKVSSQRY